MRAFFAVLAGVASSGCSLILSWGTDGLPCGSDGACAPGYACAAGKCRPGLPQDAGPQDGGGPSPDGGPVCPGGTNYAADPSNCGACGHTCLGGSCDAGSCQPLQLVSTQNPLGLYLDGGAIFWDTWLTTGEVWRASSADGGGATPLATAQNGPAWLMGHKGGVYWTTSAPDAGLWRVAEAGGPVTLVGKGGGSGAVAADEAALYFTPPDGGGLWIARLPDDGGAVSAAVCGLTSVTSLAVDGTYVYWTESGGGVFGAPKGATCAARTPLVTTATAQHLSVGPTLLYLAGSILGDAGVLAVPLWDGGAPGAPAWVAQRSEVPASLTVGPDGLYWPEYVSGNVVWLPADGGSVRTLGGRDHPIAVVADPVALYWNEFDGDGGVYKLAK